MRYGHECRKCGDVPTPLPTKLKFIICEVPVTEKSTTPSQFNGSIWLLQGVVFRGGSACFRRRCEPWVRRLGSRSLDVNDLFSEHIDDFDGDDGLSRCVEGVPSFDDVFFSFGHVCEADVESLSVVVGVDEDEVDH